MPTFRFLIPNNARHKDYVKSVEVDAELFIRNLKTRGHLVGPKDGSAIVGATLVEGGRLELKYVDQATALILDIDGKFRKGKEEYHEVVDPNWALAQIPFRGVAHTSYNHTPELPKFRIILPLREPITPKQHHRLWWYFFEKLNRKTDTSAKDASRLFFLPRIPDETRRKDAWIRELNGPFLSYMDVPASYEVPNDAVFEGPRKKQGAHRASGPDRTFPAADPTKLVPRLLELPIYVWAMENPTDVSREVWRGLATNLAAAVLESEDSVELALDAFHRVSEVDEERYNSHVTERTFRDAMRSAEQYGPMTYAHLQLNGAPDDVCGIHAYGFKSPIAQARATLKQGWSFEPPKPEAPSPAETAEAGNPTEQPAEPVTEKIPTTPKIEHVLTPKQAAAIEALKEFGPFESTALVGGSDAPTEPPTELVISPTPVEPAEPAAPPSGGDGDDVSEKDATIEKYRPEESVLHDLSDGKYYIKNEADEWLGPIGSDSFSQRLLSWGLPRKKHDDYRMNIRSFTNKEALFTSTKQLVKCSGLLKFNTYKLPLIKPVQGNWDDARECIMNLVDDDQKAAEYVLDWLAAPIQHLYKVGSNGELETNLGHCKMGTALVFYGVQGSGKGTLEALITQLYGVDFVANVGQEALDGRFNGELVDKLFVIANEVMSSTNRSAQTANKIKPWVTDDTIPVEEKFQGAKRVRNSFNIIFTSNDDRPVIIEKSDRRYSVFRSTEKFDDTVAKRLHEDMRGDKKIVQAFLYHLLCERKPAVKYGALYHTSARDEMMKSSAPSDEKFAEEIRSEGWASIASVWAEKARTDKIREMFVNGELILSETMDEVYKDWCLSHNLKPRSKNFLGQSIHSAFPKATSVRTRYGGVQRRAWQGIPLNPPDEDHATEGTVKPTPVKKSDDDADFT
jgi:hypothetical protein